MFFPLPSGEGVLHAVLGRAGAPAPAPPPPPTPAPSMATTQLADPVANWLPVAQKFALGWDAARLPPGAALKGPATIEVPPHATRELRLSFTPAVEGRAALPLRLESLVFPSEVLAVELPLEAMAAGLAGSLALSAAVCATESAVVAVPLRRAAARGRWAWTTLRAAWCRWAPAAAGRRC